MAKTLSEMIPSAIEVVRRINEIDREKRYLQRLLRIIRDRQYDEIKDRKGS